MGWRTYIYVWATCCAIPHTTHASWNRFARTNCSRLMYLPIICFFSCANQSIYGRPFCSNVTVSVRAQYFFFFLHKGYVQKVSGGSWFKCDQNVLLNLHQIQRESGDITREESSDCARQRLSSPNNKKPLWWQWGRLVVTPLPPRAQDKRWHLIWNSPTLCVITRSWRASPVFIAWAPHIIPCQYGTWNSTFCQSYLHWLLKYTLIYVPVAPVGAHFSWYVRNDT